ncbi:hypothetical protein SUGI_0507870 [Cryptomeria japonica]|uniref:uncharacterized protein LOC131076496 n=1 Tax=Cryptomeria japonica TaxID=3369 RepID=UPI002408C2E6|nr:uncharacterized protein LOC131076496 [Cryptomeria japonica]XP_057869702.1 uncharacterized protein LOC131076496 [Cryptomeria japonica]GLJ26363.1 hypothetical protein SUGI_0507870 [Cryptomeria japonica]
MEQQWELQLMPGSKQDEDEDLIPADNTGQFHSRDSLQLSIGFYEPQQQHETKVAAKQLHPSNMDENQMEKETLGQVTLCLGSGTASSAGAVVSHENQIRHEKEEEEEKAKMIAESENEDGGAAELVKQQAREQLRLATVEKAYAEHARELAKRQMELAEAEFASAKRIREQAQAELNRAQLLKEQATRRIDATCMEITCQACRQQFQYHLSWPHQPTPTLADQNRNHPTTRFIHASAITDQSSQEETYLSLQLKPQPAQEQQLLLNSSSQTASTSKQQKN